MYREFYGLTEKPFNLVPDPKYIYLSHKHKLALSMLEYGLFENAGGITVITGEVGAGKTTLIKRLLHSIDYKKTTIGMINNTHRSFGDLMQWVALAFDLPHENKDKVTLYRDIQRFLIDEYAQGRTSVLVVDEAQNIGAETLEELRLLTNINSENDQLLQIILVGQPELMELLLQPQLSQITQRIGAEYHLEALDLTDTVKYIRHRLQVAGCKEILFDKTAFLAIHVFSRGIPRLINTLCEYALLTGYALDKKTINHSVILDIVKARKISFNDWRENISDRDLGLLQKLNALTGSDVLAGIKT